MYVPIEYFTLCMYKKKRQYEKLVGCDNVQVVDRKIYITLGENSLTRLYFPHNRKFQR